MPAIGCTPDAGSEPPFIHELIVQLRDGEKRNPPASIWRYTYRDAVVYYIPPYCCDVPGELYDSAGNLVCAPDGGLDGQGDGKCPDFFRERSDEERVWSDPR